MTNRHSNSVLEQEMIDCLRRQKAYYDQATLIADEITNTMQSGVADESALTKLKAILEASTRPGSMCMTFSLG